MRQRRRVEGVEWSGEEEGEGSGRRREGAGVLSLQRAVGEVEKQGRRGRRREGRAIFHPGFPWWGVNWGKEQSDWRRGRSTHA